MIVQHNLQAQFANRNLNISNGQKKTSMEKLSSGYRVNRAADDAAGLAVSEKMRWQIRGLDKSTTNIMDGVSLVQIADGALHEVSAILQRVRELSVQAANDTNTETDRASLQAEIDESIKEVDRIAQTTNMNNIYPLNANEEFGLNPEIAANVTPTQVEKGVYNMNNDGIQIDANGTPKVVSGFKFDLEGCQASDLDGKTFFSTCAASCGQTFAFKFDANIPLGNSSSTISNSSGNDSLSVIIGLGGNPSMTDVANKIGTMIKDSNLYNSVNDTATNTFQIGHANNLTINGTSLIFYPNSGTANTSQSSHSATINGTTYNNLHMGSVYLNGLEEFVSITKTSLDYGLNIQAGALSYQAITLPLVKMSAERMGIDKLDVSSFETAGKAINDVDGAIDWVSTTRAIFGANQNRLEHAFNTNSNTSENTSAAESRIRDTDMAKEMVRLSTMNIIAQAGESMLAQANQSHQSVMNLLQ